MANKSYNIFLSWSGTHCGAAADAFRDWLPLVLETAKPWKSDSDIEKGTRSLGEIGQVLQPMKVGIVFLTPENLLRLGFTTNLAHYPKPLMTKPDCVRICSMV